MTVGVVRGTIRYPEHPDREGALGLVGGEDVVATRETFRSPGEAMTWCRKVLDGKVKPRWSAAGELQSPATAPEWFDGEVYDDEWSWQTDASTRDWFETVGNERRGPVARTDPE